MPTDSLGQGQEEVYETIVENEDKIAEVVDLVDKALNDTLHQDLVITQNDVISTLRGALLSKWDIDTVDELGMVFFNLIVRYDENLLIALRESEISADLVERLNSLAVEYQAKLANVRNKQSRGKYYLSSIDSDIVFRGNRGYHGITHHIGIAHSEQVQLDVNPYLNQTLINHLLEQQLRFYNMVGQPGGVGVNQHEDFVDIANEVVERYEDLLE